MLHSLLRYWFVGNAIRCAHCIEWEIAVSIKSRASSSLKHEADKLSGRTQETVHFCLADCLHVMQSDLSYHPIVDYDGGWLDIHRHKSSATQVQGAPEVHGSHVVHYIYTYIIKNSLVEQIIPCFHNKYSACVVSNARLCIAPFDCRPVAIFKRSDTD
jgi:hypothetical protein